MKRQAVWTMVIAIAALAGRSLAEVEIQNIPLLCDPIVIYQAYAGDSTGLDIFQEGLLGTGADVITAQPGILSIVPDMNLDGTIDWRAFTRAEIEDEIHIKGVVITKTEPEDFFDCPDIPGLRGPRTIILTQGDVRLWWPLVYEAPGTTFQLKITWYTAVRKQYPGEPEPAYAHQDIFQWIVQVDFEHLLDLLALLHIFPFGTDEVPLISDELLVSLQSVLEAPGPPRVWSALLTGELTQLVEEAETAFDTHQYTTARARMEEFQTVVADACIGESPPFPLPTGPSTGIAETLENPACCKLVLDAQWILDNVIP